MSDATIKAVAEAIWEAHGQIDRDECLPLAKAAIEAYEKVMGESGKRVNSTPSNRTLDSGVLDSSAIKEMTVDEVAKLIHGVERWCTLYHAELAAKALAKLGTIRITGGGE